VFGEHLPHLPVSGTKGYYGHALGASGAFEAAITALALSRGWVPPTVNLADREDGLDDLDLIAGVGRDLAPDVALSNSFGFGGINAALVFRRHDGLTARACRGGRGPPVTRRSRHRPARLACLPAPRVAPQRRSAPPRWPSTRERVVRL
jgi:acyl transferase domain-containing protein